ncbi:MAG: hypothetical protein Q7R62_02635 [bacterium]|nr:hypothetical protein [bacterium]
MSEKNFGHILFVIALVFIFAAFALYAAFYKATSFLIRDNVQKTLFWSKLIDWQLQLQEKTK